MSRTYWVCVFQYMRFGLEVNVMGHIDYTASITATASVDGLSTIYGYPSIGGQSVVIASTVDGEVIIEDNVRLKEC